MIRYKSVNSSKRIICPYCGSPNKDNYGLEDKVIDCTVCGHKYKMQAEASIMFTTRADCGLNKEQHKFDTLKYQQAEECTVCGKRRSL